MQPGMLLLILVVAGAALLGTRYRRAGRASLIAAAVFLVVGGIGPLSTWLILPLEERFPRADLAGRPVDGIVILGGSEDARVAKGRGLHALNELAERMTEAAALARRYPGQGPVHRRLRGNLARADGRGGRGRHGAARSGHRR